MTRRVRVCSLDVWSAILPHILPIISILWKLFWACAATNTGLSCPPSSLSVSSVLPPSFLLSLFQRLYSQWHGWEEHVSFTPANPILTEQMPYPRHSQQRILGLCISFLSMHLNYVEVQRPSCATPKAPVPSHRANGSLQQKEVPALTSGSMT